MVLPAMSKSRGVALDQFINIVVVERLSALNIETYLQERAAKGNIPAALAILDKAGSGHKPPPEDRLNAEAL